jgi:SPP1 family phage portal protein
MFTVDKGASLNKDMIEEAIHYNEDNRANYTKKENYYLGNHAILNRHKSLVSKNTKVVTNHAKYITNINTGYLLGNPVIYKVLDENRDIDNILEQYGQQSIADLDVELAKEISIFGKQYELIYNNKNNIRSKTIDVRQAVCIYDDTVEHNKLYGIVYSLKKKRISGGLDKVTIYTDKEIYQDCVTEDGNVRIPSDPIKHNFKQVPLIEYINNREEQGDFEQVIPLIDAYNLLQSDRINDKQQLVESILLGYGTSLTPKQRSDLEKNRMLFDLPIKGEATIEYLTKNLDETQVNILRSNIEDDIHKISLTPNMSDENFAGNSSGVALAYKLLPFDQNIKNKERFFEKGLMERIQLYNNYLTSLNKGVDLETYQVDAVFNRNLPQNILEISQIVNNLRGIVDDETLISQIPFVENPKESIKLAKEQGLQRFIENTSGFGTGEPDEEE